MNIDQLRHKLDSRAAYDTIFKLSTVLTDVVLHGNYKYSTHKYYMNS